MRGVCSELARKMNLLSYSTLKESEISKEATLSLDEENEAAARGYAAVRQAAEDDRADAVRHKARRLLTENIKCSVRTGTKQKQQGVAQRVHCFNTSLCADELK